MAFRFPISFRWITALVPGLLSLVLGLSGCGSDSSGQTTVGALDQPAVEKAGREKVILFFGNSLSAGYGLQEGESFPALIEARLDSLGYPYRVVNAGVSGETSSGGTGRIDWVLRQPVDIFVLELGGNDGLRGIEPRQTKANLQQIIDAVWEKYPEAHIVLAGMQIPPNMGPEYTEAFRRIFPELARENRSLTFLPFLLEGVGGDPKYNQPDGIHPNAAGARIVAENVWQVLEPHLDKDPET